SSFSAFEAFSAFSALSLVAIQRHFCKVRARSRPPDPSLLEGGSGGRVRHNRSRARGPMTPTTGIRSWEFFLVKTRWAGEVIDESVRLDLSGRRYRDGRALPSVGLAAGGVRNGLSLWHARRESDRLFPSRRDHAR